MKKTLSILLSIVIFATSIIPLSASAESYNTPQTAESIFLNKSATETYKLGEAVPGDYDSWVDYDVKYYKFTAPETKYYEFEVTGYDQGVFSAGTSGSAYIGVTDNSGVFIGSVFTNDYTGLTKEAYQLKKGTTYFIEVENNGLYNLASYKDNDDWQYAEQALTLTVREHIHSMYVSYAGEYTTYYECYNCDYCYYKDVPCKHKHTAKTVTKQATYWTEGRYNLYCTDCGKTIKKDVKIAKKAATLSSVKAGKKQATVKWKKVSGAKSYQIQYSTKSNFSGAKTIKATGTSKTVKKLKKGKKYYFRVRAVKGNSKSSWSKSKSVKIK